MTVQKIFLATLFFAIVPISYTLGQEAPLKEDVKYDEVQANPNDYQLAAPPPTVDEPKVHPKVMVANCDKHKCPSE